MHFIINLGLGSATLLELALLVESDPNFPWENSHLGQQSVQQNNMRLCAHSRLHGKKDNRAGRLKGNRMSDRKTDECTGREGGEELFIYLLKAYI